MFYRKTESYRCIREDKIEIGSIREENKKNDTM
mgnify:CR=1 FL=1